jgi:acetate---CoA ligase (ADP-forming)
MRAEPGQGALKGERAPGLAANVAIPAGLPGRVVGVARYERTAGDAAGFLVFVDAAWRRAGLGTLLLRRLAGAARHAGVRRLVSDVPTSDVAVLGPLAELGLEYEEQATAAGVHASFAVQETGAYLEAVLADQRAAARAAVAPFLRPESIAVVGASDNRGSIGWLLLANLLQSGFTGPVYPVNPRHRVIQGVTAYQDLASCPGPPDLALVAVPAPLVAGVVDRAGDLGVRAVCVISAGFAETGGEGRVLQEDLLRRARVGGVRLIGPNCMGLLSGGPDRRFNATFSPAFPPPGRLAFVSQSGGLGLAALALLAGPALGVSGFVSVGNTGDLAPNDLLRWSLGMWCASGWVTSSPPTWCCWTVTTCGWSAPSRLPHTCPWQFH